MEHKEDPFPSLTICNRCHQVYHSRKSLHKRNLPCVTKQQEMLLLRNFCKWRDHTHEQVKKRRQLAWQAKRELRGQKHATQFTLKILKSKANARESCFSNFFECNSCGKVETEVNISSLETLKQARKAHEKEKKCNQFQLLKDLHQIRQEDKDKDKKVEKNDQIWNTFVEPLLVCTLLLQRVSFTSETEFYHLHYLIVEEWEGCLKVTRNQHILQKPYDKERNKYELSWDAINTSYSFFIKRSKKSKSCI